MVAKVPTKALRTDRAETDKSIGAGEAQPSGVCRHRLAHMRRVDGLFGSMGWLVVLCEAGLWHTLGVCV